MGQPRHGKTTVATEDLKAENLLFTRKYGTRQELINRFKKVAPLDLVSVLKQKLNYKMPQGYINQEVFIFLALVSILDGAFEKEENSLFFKKDETFLCNYFQISPFEVQARRLALTFYSIYGALVATNKPIYCVAEELGLALSNTDILNKQDVLKSLVLPLVDTPRRERTGILCSTSRLAQTGFLQLE